MRRLKIFGTLKHTKGSLQTLNPPGSRCSQKTAFQLPKRMDTMHAVVIEIVEIITGYRQAASCLWRSSL
ncbi:hypothetical protein BK664_00640 [Pseudomonas brassicacearum]|uniref:Uncharacterized protein n=1 Tax=Pseudomonas brassicacearum TaxID=930166 RepID=A0A423JWS5_9PSED|nr:hypothetical protein BK664_00640 [Pseudomonas brassicacearum]